MCYNPINRLIVHQMLLRKKIYANDGKGGHRMLVGGDKMSELKYSYFYFYFSFSMQRQHIFKKRMELNA